MGTAHRLFIVAAKGHITQGIHAPDNYHLQLQNEISFSKKGIRIYVAIVDEAAPERFSHPDGKFISDDDKK